MVAKIVLLLFLLIPALFALLYIVPRIIATYFPQRPIPTRRVQSVFTIFLSEDDSLVFRFADEGDINRHTHRVHELRPGVWEYVDHQGNILQIRFENTELFFPLLRENEGLYEAAIMRRIVDVPALQESNTTRRS